MQAFGIKGIIAWIAIMALISSDQRIFYREYVGRVEKKKYSFQFALIVFLPVILWAGFRNGAGYVDTNAYIRFFNEIPAGFGNIISYIKNVYSEDVGFTFYMGTIKTFLGENYRPFLLISACIQGIIITRFYQKYSTDYIFSIFLFVASTEYFSWMFNGMRQFMAITIILLAFQLYLDKKYYKYALMIILACTIHATAIIMIPVAFVVRGKPWNKRTMIAIFVTVLALTATERFTDMLDTAMQYTQYSDAVSSWVEMGDDGTNPIRVFVQAIPTILAFIGRRIINEKDNQFINICVNMSIVSTSLWIVSMVTSGIYMGRLPGYVNLFNYILLPFEIENLFEKNSTRIIKTSTILMYLVYYYYQFHFAWGVI